MLLGPDSTKLCCVLYSFSVVSEEGTYRPLTWAQGPLTRKPLGRIGCFCAAQRDFQRGVREDDDGQVRGHLRSWHRMPAWGLPRILVFSRWYMAIHSKLEASFHVLGCIKMAFARAQPEKTLAQRESVTCTIQ